MTRDHLHPNEALAKAASQERLKAGFVPLVCRAYNTGVQEAQRQTSSTAREKFASFPLADSDAVERIMFPKAQAPVESLRKTAVDAAYSQPPVITRKQLRRNELLKTALEKQASTEERPQPAGPSFEQRRLHYHQLKKEAREARVAALEASDELHRRLDRLRSYFKQARDNDLGFAEVKEALSLRRDKAGLALLEVVKPSRVKAARERLVLYDPARQPYGLIQDCIDAAQRKLEADERVKHAEAKVSEEGNSLLRPFEEPPAGDYPLSVVNLKPVVKEARPLSAFTWGAGSQMGSRLTQMLGVGPSTPSDEAKIWSQLDDPKHDAQLRSLRVQSTLNDLLSNDPVISGYDPTEVLEAYNELAQLAPRATAHTASLRALLRRRLQGDIAPFEIEQISNIEKGLRSREPPVPAEPYLMVPPTPKMVS